MSMALKAILFDLDNTISDFMTMKHKSCEAAVDAMIAAGLAIEKEKALEIMFDIYEEIGIEDQHIFEKFLKKLNGGVNYKMVAHGIIAYRKTREGLLKPYPNVIPTLLALKKKYKLAIISDAPRLQAYMRLCSMNIVDFFDVIITAADVRKTKRFSAPYKAALSALDIKPQDAMMVGDKVHRDVLPAKKLGIIACYAKYGDTHVRSRVLKTPLAKGESGADFEINEFREILNLPIIKGEVIELKN